MLAQPIICLMGPTAAGKTPLAIELVQRFPCEIISVDSAMVYRGMNIGTAKPDAKTLAIAPHRLINIRDPREPYSAGEFRQDALHEIRQIIAAGKIPLLVGGTMLYFRVLQQGIADLPTANATIRAKLQTQIEQEGVEALHAMLTSVDPVSAKRIHANDRQRLQRALEVFLLTGKPISVWQAEGTELAHGYQFHHIALIPSDRQLLHQRIAIRFEQMLKEGLIEEVRSLYERNDLTADLPSIRSVGYRQVWAYLENELDSRAMSEQSVAATRQLAKRQLTWLRTWPNLINFFIESTHLHSECFHKIDQILSIS